MHHHAEVLKAEYDAVAAPAGEMTSDALADVLIESLVKLSPQTRAMTALLDSRSDLGQLRRRFAAECVSGIQAAVMAPAQS
ncbi:hypothetical protein, partial [Bradyrhizobium sp.]|uniref:hypothetical protein n=1 Tax=Bradyrhizobium sp. TaxID=376 RepID=UPI003C5A91E9